MNLKSAFVVTIALGFSTSAFAGQTEGSLLGQARVLILTVPATPIVPQAPPMKRPALLPALYASLGAMQAWDVYSTSAALKAGAKEANPTAAPFASNQGAMIGVKAATTATTIFFAERMWKKNRVGAVIMLAAINGATAAVAMRNMQNARNAASTR
jgi:hypothetical protein